MWALAVIGTFPFASRLVLTQSNTAKGSKSRLGNVLFLSVSLFMYISYAQGTGKTGKTDKSVPCEHTSPSSPRASSSDRDDWVGRLAQAQLPRRPSKKTGKRASTGKKTCHPGRPTP